MPRDFGAFLFIKATNARMIFKKLIQNKFKFKHNNLFVYSRQETTRTTTNNSTDKSRLVPKTTQQLQ